MNNRAQFWLLLLLGVILIGTAGIWYWHHGTPSVLTEAALATPASPIQISDISRRRPTMLVFDGKAAPGATVTIRQNGQDVGTATAAASDGSFSITTKNLPRADIQSLELVLADAAPYALIVIDRKTHFASLVRGPEGWQPLQHPRTGTGLITISQGQTENGAPRLAISGQAPTGTSLYIYADGELAGKRTIKEGDTVEQKLFTFALEGDRLPKDNLRVDAYNAEGHMTSRVGFDLPVGEGKNWQRVQGWGDIIYLSRNFDSQQLDPAKEYPGQFIPVATPVAATSEAK